MNAVERRLAGISTGYSVFEKDQVLTHDQLNSVAEYADDQIRLTRVGLLGVGIACGLRATLSGAQVRVSSGIGVTTDGDLVYLPQDRVFDHFKPYDRSYPAYAPLYVAGDVNGAMTPAYELVQGTSDPRGVALGGFAGTAGRALGTMSALLLVESYDKTDDLCTGTDCDNLGGEALNTLKVLLVGTPPGALLQQAIATPSQAFAGLSEVVVDRPAFPASLNSADALAAVYRTTCNGIYNRLVTALPTLNTTCGAFLSDVVGTGSAATWTAKLNSYNTTFAGPPFPLGIQYYYDFLKDVAETLNEFRACFFGDFTTCAPPAETFPKHLLLGDLTTSADPDANRTGFYPSPVTSRAAGELDHARFLLRRLDALIMGFELHTGSGTPIRITPSAFEDRPLDERAIPYYYAPNGTPGPIQLKWSYSLARRAMAAFTHSYHATGWGAQTGTSDPLARQIGRFSFFRIEGHLGKAVDSALSTLEGEIKARNLPFTARAVHLGTDVAKVVKKPGQRITDLHHIHHIVREDVARRLQEAQTFNVVFTAELGDAVQHDRIDDDGDDYEAMPVHVVASQKSQDVARYTAGAQGKLREPYSTYAADRSAWHSDAGGAIRAAGEFKYELGAVAKTHFVTPFDTLISQTLVDWIPWLEQIIDWKQARADQRLLFSSFAEEHPQMEHFGGVSRGGTFVLLHDAANVVVGDFMLPYAWSEERFETQEPTLTDVEIRPPYIIDHGIKVVPSQKTVLTKEWERRIPEFQKQVDWKPYLDNWLELESRRIQDKLDAQTLHLDDIKSYYFETLHESIAMVQKPMTSVSTPIVEAPDLTDSILDMHLKDTSAAKDRVNRARKTLDRTDLTSKQREEAAALLDRAESELAATIGSAAGYIADAKLDVAPGSEAHTVLLLASSARAALTDTAKLETLNRNLAETVGRAGDTAAVASFNAVFAFQRG